jgi:hypothetical protein
VIGRTRHGLLAHGLNIAGQVCGTPIFAHVNWFHETTKTATASGPATATPVREVFYGMVSIRTVCGAWRRRGQADAATVACPGWSGAVNDPRA